jgi:hypothetical protein
MDSQQKKLLMEISAGVLAVVIISAAVYYGRGAMNQATPEAVSTVGTSTKVLGQDAFRPADAKALETVEGGTREQISRTISTPNVGATGTPADVAVPSVIAPQKFSDYRKYFISGAGGKFSASTFVINTLDNVEIQFTATDGDYNFNISDMGLNQTIKKGETGTIMFQGANYGQFTIKCNTAICASNPVVGTLIVNQR